MNSIFFFYLDNSASCLIVLDVQDSDRHAYEWQRCLASCKTMLNDANNIFNRINSSTVCTELIRSEEGKAYVEGDNKKIMEG